MRNFEQRLLKQGASWAAPAQGPTYKATLGELRRAELALADARRILGKAMVTTRRNSAGVRQIALLAGRARRAAELVEELRQQLQG